MWPLAGLAKGVEVPLQGKASRMYLRNSTFVTVTTQGDSYIWDLSTNVVFIQLTYLGILGG